MKNEMELYVHIPFCMKKCNYCDFLSGPWDADIRKKYTNALCQELRFLGKKYQGSLITSVYIGGGTPSWLELDCMEEILATILSNFTILGGAEWTMEVNPGTVTKDALNLYRSFYVNRLSIGLQSANDDELKLLGRVHDYHRFLHTYELVRNAGFRNVSVDIMTGLPYQTKEKLLYTLEEVVRLKPEHISSYSLIIEEGTNFYEKYKFDEVAQHAGMQTEALPSEDLEYELQKMSEYFLEDHGYHRYEISNFARPGFEGIHNSGYWKRAFYIGAGLGASSFVDGRRCRNETDMYEYLEKCERLNQENLLYIEEEEITRSNAMAEFMFLGLRMTEGVLTTDFESEFGLPLMAIYGKQIEVLKQEELLVVESGRVYLTERGMDLGNYVFSQFV